jgi:hypothetical protein
MENDAVNFSTSFLNKDEQFSITDNVFLSNVDFAKPLEPKAHSRFTLPKFSEVNEFITYPHSMGSKLIGGEGRWNPPK